MQRIVLPIVMVTLLARAARPDEGAEVRDYLMEFAGTAGIGSWMDRHRLSAKGWIEGSFTWNPESEDNVLRLFDDKANEPLLNQLYLGVERSLPDGTDGGVGGKVALLYGSDGRYIHERGLLDDQDGNNQFDLLEFYVSGRVPVGRGIVVKAGKVTTPIGAEVIEAPGNPLFSHTVSFNFGIPFTHTGIMATWTASEKIDVLAGAFLGWDVWDDPNDSLSYHGGITVRGDAPGDSLTLQAIAGPEQADNDSDVRVLFDATWRRGWTERLSTAVDAIWGSEEGAAAGADAQWYGVAAYATRQLGEAWSGTLRVEWFRDEDGTRVGFPADLYSLTFGVDGQPFRKVPNLRVRPELRWDHAAGDRPFDGDADQITIAVDVIFRF